MKQASTDTFTQMTTEPLSKLIPRLAFPCIVSMLVTSIYNMADTFFVGQLGDNAASGAVGVVYSLMMFILACGLFFGQGSGNYISRELGKKNLDGATAMASTGFYLSIGTGVVICCIGLVLGEPLVYFLGATDTIAPLATSYQTYILIGAPFMIGSYVLNNQLRYQGKTTLSMLGMAAGSVLNIFLDPIFIFLCGMGVSGAALATCLSQMVSFFLLLWLTTRDGLLGVPLSHFRPSIPLFKQILGGGLPSLGRNGLATVGIICLNQAAGIYGDAAIAAISVVTRIINFGFSAMVGFGQGFQPVCGYSYGAGLYSRVREGFWYCVRSSLLVLAILGGIGVYFAPNLVAIFRDDPQVITYGALALRCQCITLVTFSFIVPCNMMLQTIGRTVPATVVATARQGFILIPVIWLLSTSAGLTGILVAQGVADVLTLAVCIPLQWSVLQELKAKDDTPLQKPIDTPS